VSANRQFEYLIRFTGFCREDLARCVAKLPRRPEGRGRRPHYVLRLEEDGFYFQDLTRSDFSASILRTVLELALEHSEVQIEGFGSGAPPRASDRVTGDDAGIDAALAEYRGSLAGFRPEN